MNSYEFPLQAQAVTRSLFNLIESTINSNVFVHAIKVYDGIDCLAKVI